jgi:hypothetical protein
VAAAQQEKFQGFALTPTSPSGLTGNRLFRKHPQGPYPPGKNFSKSGIFLLTSFCPAGIVGNMRLPKSHNQGKPSQTGAILCFSVLNDPAGLFLI